MKSLTLDHLLLKPAQVFLDKDTYVWIRSLTQMERDLCQAHARKHSRDIRKKLADRTSEEYSLLVEDELSEYDIKRLQMLWVSNRLIRKTLEINQQSLEEREYIPEPENDPSNEAWDTYEDSVEESDESREKAVRSALASAKEKLEEDVKGISDENLSAEAEPALIEHILNQLWQNKFTAQMIFRATFKDKQCAEKAFASVDEVETLKPPIYDLLVKSHIGLLVEPEPIKN